MGGNQSVLNFMWFAIGAGVLIVALALASVLLRLRRTLTVLEEVLMTANEEMRDTLPEVRGSLENVNEITEGVNVALQVGGTAAVRSSRSVRAGMYGVGVGLKSLLGSGAGRPQTSEGGSSGGQ